MEHSDSDLDKLLAFLRQHGALSTYPRGAQGEQEALHQAFLALERRGDVARTEFEGGTVVVWRPTAAGPGR
jgi:hypothetical protein